MNICIDKNYTLTIVGLLNTKLKSQAVSSVVVAKPQLSRRKAVLQFHAYFHKLQSTCLQLSVSSLKIQYVVTEQKVLTLIVIFKRKDLKIIINQISTVKTNFNDKISPGINSVRNAEYFH